MFLEIQEYFFLINWLHCEQQGKGRESTYLCIQKVEITFILFKFHRSIDNSNGFYIFVLL